MNLVDIATKNYKRGLWTKEMLSALVLKDNVAFTKEDYQAITGEELN